MELSKESLLVLVSVFGDESSIAFPMKVLNQVLEIRGALAKELKKHEPVATQQVAEEVAK